MEWHKNYNIGVEAVDRQHQELFRMVTQLQDSLSSSNLNKEIVSVLIFLVKYTKQHFADEEELMDGINYPELERQKVLHKKMIEEVNGAVVSIKQRRPIDVFKLVDFLIEWLLQHIEQEDQKIGDFIAQMKLVEKKSD